MFSSFDSNRPNRCEGEVRGARPAPLDGCRRAVRSCPDPPLEEGTRRLAGGLPGPVTAELFLPKKGPVSLRDAPSRGSNLQGLAGAELRGSASFSGLTVTGFRGASSAPHPARWPWSLSSLHGSASPKGAGMKVCSGNYQTEHWSSSVSPGTEQGGAAASAQLWAWGSVLGLSHMCRQDPTSSGPQRRRLAPVDPHFSTSISLTRIHRRQVSSPRH